MARQAYYQDDLAWFTTPAILTMSNGPDLASSSCCAMVAWAPAPACWTSAAAAVCWPESCVPPDLRCACRCVAGDDRAGARVRRSDEHHRNMTFDADEALRILRGEGVDARERASFGAEALPAGLVVLAGVRR